MLLFLVRTLFSLLVVVSVLTALQFLPIPNSVTEWHSTSFNSDSNELIINPVMLSHNNKTFTCVVSSDLLDINLTEDITITVLG